jgi:hypothetical protein
LTAMCIKILRQAIMLAGRLRPARPVVPRKRAQTHRQASDRLRDQAALALPAISGKTLDADLLPGKDATTVVLFSVTGCVNRTCWGKGPDNARSGLVRVRTMTVRRRHQRSHIRTWYEGVEPTRDLPGVAEPLIQDWRECPNAPASSSLQAFVRPIRFNEETLAHEQHPSQSTHERQSRSDWPA